MTVSSYNVLLVVTTATNLMPAPAYSPINDAQFRPHRPKRCRPTPGQRSHSRRNIGDVHPRPRNATVGNGSTRAPLRVQHNVVEASHTATGAGAADHTTARPVSLRSMKKASPWWKAGEEYRNGTCDQAQALLPGKLL